MGNAPYFSEDGVFVHEMMFYLPGDYCVEAELDTYEYDEIVNGDIEMTADIMQAIHLYLKVIICEDKAISYAGCSSKEDCYSRCCLPWQSLKREKCQMTTDLKLEN